MKLSKELIIVIDRLRNRKRLWNLPNALSLASNNPESLSELDDYLTICKLASQDDKFFKKFRSCSSYRAILENVDGKSGLELVNAFERLGKDVSEFRHLWHGEIGAPYKYHVKRAGYVSPTELRYSKIILELETLFGSLDSYSISEIGVGFGGQGGQILASSNVRSYEFIDLVEPLGLVKRYLKEIQQLDKAVFTTPNNLQKGRRDLVISNYAFSELNRELQESYFEKVISQSTRGFVIYNHITPPNYKTMTAAEFASRIPTSEIFSETPLSYPGNVLVTWGHSGSLGDE
jgi:putative sugar O-methyltransferase